MITRYPSPGFLITLDEQDITGKIAPRLVSLTLTECAGDDSDQLDLTLSDADGKLAIPPRGAKINLHIGWAQDGLVNKGEFTVDEVEHSGTPDQITLRARTANLIDAFRQLQEASFHDTTLGAIIELIAFKNELQSGIADSLRNVVVMHLDQTRESDAAFLRRLGKKYDATATVKNNTLLFIPTNQSKTASGKALPIIHLTRQLGDSHRYHSSERDSYSGVRVFWHDQKYAVRKSVVAGNPGNSKRLRTTYANETDARQAAVAEWQRLQRGLATFELALALGNPALMPKSPVTVSGFKDAIDQVEWQAVKTIHSISDGGFTTRIELETKVEEAEAEREPQTDPDEGITGVLTKWKEKGRNRSGEELAGSTDNAKTLELVYASRQYAAKTARDQWVEIQERREIIAENNRD
ncbi:phage late control D family protein [Solimicrobium silvestre]|uniref:Phage protein D n=1 Tax=Solimicrobium silvestre TaxID=2099400 RepID=A0A2S9GTE9_9BURK|nr:phage late control D family protein [Solimicrobium silvestre]PRC90985.1 Phage protein D [Solimicrobium silvestre]